MVRDHLDLKASYPGSAGVKEGAKKEKTQSPKAKP